MLAQVLSVQAVQPMVRFHFNLLEIFRFLKKEYIHDDLRKDKLKDIQKHLIVVSAAKKYNSNTGLNKLEDFNVRFDFDD